MCWLFLLHSATIPIKTGKTTNLIFVMGLEDEIKFQRHSGHRNAARSLFAPQHTWAASRDPPSFPSLVITPGPGIYNSSFIYKESSVPLKAREAGACWFQPSLNQSQGGTDTIEQYLTQEAALCQPSCWQTNTGYTSLFCPKKELLRFHF